VQRGFLAVEAGTEGSLPSITSTANGEGFEEQLILGSLGGCFSPTPLGACLVAKAGTLRVRGVGVDVSRSTYGLVAQAGPRFMLSQRLGGAWSGAIRVELLVALVPWGVVLDHEEVWKTPPLGISVGVDVFALIHDNRAQDRTIPMSR
jgi:hypothetical protein